MPRKQKLIIKETNEQVELAAAHFGQIWEVHLDKGYIDDHTWGYWAVVDESRKPETIFH